MQAAQIIDRGHQPTLVTIPTPQPEAGYARVRVAFAALNRRDVWIQRGQYAGLQYPAILGSDVSGVVDAVGDESGTVWLEREVIVNPNIDWGFDEQAQSPSYQILGMPCQGALAEYICVPYSRLCNKPQHLSLCDSAALPLAGLTAYRATVIQAKLQSAETVLVSGIGGGVALFVLQFARALGAQVITTSRSDMKLQRSKELGARYVVSVADEAWVKNVVRETKEVDCVIDSVGGSFINDYFQILRPGGRVVSYGSTLGATPSLELRRIFWKQLHWIGSTMGSDRDFEEMVSFVCTHHIKPVIDKVFDFADVAAAFEHLANNEQFGKVIVKLRAL